MNKKISIAIAIGTMILILVLVYLNFDSVSHKGAKSLEKQLNAIIQNHDLETMKKIAADDYSYQFLSESTSKDVATSDTDMQGGNEDSYFYMALLRGHPLGVTMNRQSRILIGPDYEISQVQVFP